jgi:exonuclease III
MTSINVHSQNLRGNLNEESLTLISTLLSQDCECTAILLQDIGTTGPEGSPMLRSILGEHNLNINFSSTNKARTVAIITHKSWTVKRVLKDKSGSLVGALITKGGLNVMIISAYLPTSLDNHGAPSVWRSEDTDLCSMVQQEAHSIYCTLQEWIDNETFWLIGGDMNETRALIDRKRVTAYKMKPNKFISNFLDDSEGVDVWRNLFPSKAGFTHKDSRCDSFSRIDYFIASSLLFKNAQNLNMSICNWYQTRITLE